MRAYQFEFERDLDARLPTIFGTKKDDTQEMVGKRAPKWELKSKFKRPHAHPTVNC